MTEADQKVKLIDILMKHEMFVAKSQYDRDEMLRDVGMFIDFTERMTHCVETIIKIMREEKMNAIMWAGGLTGFAALLSNIPFDWGYIPLSVLCFILFYKHKE